MTHLVRAGATPANVRLLVADNSHTLELANSRYCNGCYFMARDDKGGPGCELFKGLQLMPLPLEEGSKNLVFRARECVDAQQAHAVAYPGEVEP